MYLQKTFVKNAMMGNEMRVLTILGARPQFIKHAIVQKQMHTFGFQETLLHTGQHFDPSMSEIFFEELGISMPNLYLKVEGKDSLLQLSAMLDQMHQKLQAENFNYVLVYGDTTSTLAGSLFAHDRGFPLVHIEAGLRSGDLNMPEERNRLICDHLSSFLFAPTQSAVQNLKDENIKGKIILSGDVMQESFLHFLPKVKKPLESLPQDFILCTLHRQSNVDHKERLEFLLDGLEEIAQKTAIVLPLHPRTKQRIKDFELKLSEKIIVISPQGYLQTLWLMTHSSLVLTDSGGLQKEAYFARKKCLILREVSEWSELIEYGASELLGKRSIQEALDSLSPFSAPSFLYGQGKSVELILNTLKENR